MHEIGGYLEFEHYNKTMLHDDAIKLNCGRNALAYIIKAYNINKIAIPKFMCDSCDGVLKGLKVRQYSIGIDFKPSIDHIDSDEWLYVVNFYGQLSREYLLFLKAKYNLIVDNAHAYFDGPLNGVPTLYTCRKFFGVTDGAILYSDKTIEIKERDESFERMHFLMGRYERSATEFYSEYVNNNHIFASEPIKRMSALTENLLRGIEYDEVCRKRKDNYTFLFESLRHINKLNLIIPNGAFMYPLYIENGNAVRIKLQAEKIFIPTLWPAVFQKCKENDLEYDMAKNILPIPVDQRYEREDMNYIIGAINRIIEEINVKNENFKRIISED